jgi:hypothetical protein
MRALPQLTLLLIVVADGRNLLESARQALPQYQHLCADLMEKLSQQYQLAVLSKDLAANQGVYMPPQLLQQLLA